MTSRQRLVRTLILFGVVAWVGAIASYALHGPKPAAPTAFIVGLITLAIASQLRGGFR